MIIKGKQALADYLGYSYSMIDTNFPKVAQQSLAKGIKITRTGKGQNVIYEIENVEPQNISSQEFSVRKREIAQDLPGEIWIQAFESPKHEVSNLGRVRVKKSKVLIKGVVNPRGYIYSELIGGRKIFFHRLILQSFNPIEDYQNYTVDHINGIRADNRLENLRWVTNEENTLAMILQRAELNKELTRIIQKLGYDGTLELLQSL